ncbi:MAG: PilZ domain-containing protein [Chitinivibrionales bacterium]
MGPVESSSEKISDERAFIRHPAEIPIEYEVVGVERNQRQLFNISRGGLAFRCDHNIPENTNLIIRVPVIAPHVSMRGKVIWSRYNHNYFDMGIQFTDPESGFRIRMIEQICHIEQYKKTIAQTEGRVLSGEQAASEWIEKYAGQFPSV